MRGSPPPALQPRPPCPAAAPLSLSHHWVLLGKAPPAAPNSPYPGCRWARCLAGVWALWASSAALLKGSRGRSSPAHCAVAPAAGSPCPLPLLPALLPLWGHGRAASYNLHPAWKTGPLPPEPWDTWQETCPEAARHLHRWTGRGFSRTIAWEGPGWHWQETTPPTSGHWWGRLTSRGHCVPDTAQAPSPIKHRHGTLEVG